MLHQKITAVNEKRAGSGPLPASAGAYSSSNDFRVHSHDHKPKAKRWDNRFSVEYTSHQTSQFKASAKGIDFSSTIPLNTARPAPEFYPWQSISMRETPESRNAQNIEENGGEATICSKGDQAYDLAVVLNYGYAGGSPQVLRFLTEHIEMIHNPPYSDWETTITCGSTSATDMAFRIFCNRGDSVLVEDYTYPGTTSAGKAQGLNMVGVKMDEQGLVPEDMDLILNEWNPARGPKPFVLYTIPCGQNPTGATQGLERRRAIYAVAEKHDLFILEDDPYFYMQMGAAASGLQSKPMASKTEDEFLRCLPASYLSLDVSGRVARMDSTSKILAPGLRLGWITASSQVIDKFLLHNELANNAPNGPSQVMLYKLLDENWGHAGFVKWLMHISERYEHRRNLLVEACERSLPSGICSWVVPREGMFLWIKVDASKHPELHVGEGGNLLDIEHKIFESAKRNKVLLSKGSWFAAESRQPSDIFLRLTFAAAPEESLTEAIRRFGKALQDEVCSQPTADPERYFQSGRDAQQDWPRSPPRSLASSEFPTESIQYFAKEGGLLEERLLAEPVVV